jgi:hypothetical protein
MGGAWPEASPLVSFFRVDKGMNSKNRKDKKTRKKQEEEKEKKATGHGKFQP